MKVTTDHSHVEELVSRGEISRSEAAEHPLRSLITQALGIDDHLHVDYHVLHDEPCRLLLCSDGLSNEIDAEEIRSLLIAEHDPEAAAEAFILLTLNGCAADNVTAVVVDVSFHRTADVDITEPRHRDTTAP